MSLTFALACPAAAAQVPVAPPPHLALDELVKEYQRLGLPLPPKDAELVRLKINGKPHRLALRCPPETPGDNTTYLIGSHYTLLWNRETVEPVKPSPDVIEGVTPTWSSDLLCLAVQCRLRGWNDLATALNTRGAIAITANEEVVTEYDWGLKFGGRGRSVAVPGLRSKNFSIRSIHEELRLAASQYWQSQVMQVGTDRVQILKYLKITEPEAKELIHDLEITVAPRTSKPGTVEALIDDLTDYAGEGWSGVVPRGENSYRKLKEIGFDAIPALMNHLSDERLSRYYGSKPANGSPFGSGYNHYEVRVKHLVARLLDDLSGGEIGGRTLQDTIPDLGKVRKWWAKAQKVGEEKWLIEHALPIEDPPNNGLPIIINETEFPGPNELVLRTLGAKYPNRLAEVYEKVLQTRPNLDCEALARAVVASKLPPERKIALLEAGASHERFIQRRGALMVLADYDKPRFRRHLIATLKWFPRDIEGTRFLWSPEGDIVGLVRTANNRECWDALASTTRRVGVGLRKEIIGLISKSIDTENDKLTRLDRIKFLMGFLNDQSSRDMEERPDREPAFYFLYETYPDVAVCDLAAGQLAYILGLEIKPNQDAPPGSRLIVRAVIAKLAADELATARKP